MNRPERNRTVTTENPADATETDDRADTPAADTEAANEDQAQLDGRRARLYREHLDDRAASCSQTAAVELSRQELKAALSAVDGFCRIMRHNNRPVWPEVEVLRYRLERAHTRLARKTRADSPTRSWEREPVPTSNAWMTTAEAAKALRMSHRALQLRATELDAVKRGGRWWFPSATIRDMQRFRGIQPTWPT